MKKLFLLLIAAMMLSVSTMSQSFNGVQISGDINSFISSMKSKGYVFHKWMNGGGAIMKGQIGGNNVEVYVSVTPKTKVVWKVSVYFSEVSTWGDMKTDYFKFKQLITDKYGAPGSEYEYFSNPYYEGDGYEMTALSVGKAVYSSFWFDQAKLNIEVSATKFSQLRITYENAANVELFDKEKKQLESSVL